MKLASTLIGWLIVFPSLAQYDGKDAQVASRFRPGIMWFNTGWLPADENSAPKYDRLMLDLTYNTWLSGKRLVDAKPGSIGFNIHGMRDIPIARGNAFGLGIGLSYRYQRVRYDGVMFRDSPTRSTRLQSANNSVASPGKSVFGSHAFAVPLELRFRIPRWRHVKLHVGAHIGYRVQLFTKVWYDETMIRDRFFFDEQPLFYGLHARVGVRNLAFFADYSLTKQFKAGESTQLQPLAFGITLSFF